MSVHAAFLPLLVRIALGVEAPPTSTPEPVAAPTEPADPNMGADDENAPAELPRATRDDHSPEHAPQAAQGTPLEVGSSETRAAIWKDFVEAETDTRLKQHGSFCAEAASERRKAHYRNNSAAGANVLTEGAAASTGAERAAAAVNVAPTGVEAGIVVSPLAFRNSSGAWRPVGFTLLFAALKDSKTRVGAGIGWTVTDDPDTANLARRQSCKKGGMGRSGSRSQRRSAPRHARPTTRCVAKSSHG